MPEINRDTSAEDPDLDRDEPRAVPFATIGQSGHRTTARDMERLLAHEWDADARGG
jgi:hypothetical protein